MQKIDKNQHCHFRQTKPSKDDEKGWKYDSDHIAASKDDDKEDEEGGNLLLSLLPRSLLLIISDLSRFLSLPAGYSLHSADILKMASL